jgi:hypothetical protein
LGPRLVTLRTALQGSPSGPEEFGAELGGRAIYPLDLAAHLTFNR